MGLFGQLAREYMRHQSHHNRRRYRRSTWGIGPRRPPRSRGYYTFGPPRSRGYYPMRRQRGSNVRVVGCCLPIPIGIVGLLMLLRTAFVRVGR